MAEKQNLATEMERRLPAELLEFMQQAGLLAAGRGEKLFLVGGVPRDLLLGRDNLDIDLVVEGDAVELAKKLAETNGAKVTLHHRFRTATLKWDNRSVDLVTARSERYDRPGALPLVKPASLKADLARRDFTINTLAAGLSPGDWGEITDFYGGRDDLEAGLVRVLHEGSFIDDATRIWRAARYEQRLGFRLERRTLRLLKRDIPMLETISADRLRHELMLVLEEKEPENVLHRLDKLGALAQIHPGLEGDAWLARKFRQARRRMAPEVPSVALCLALLAWRLPDEENEKLVQVLKLPGRYAAVLRDCRILKNRLWRLSEPEIARSDIYYLLQGVKPAALGALFLAADSALVRSRIRLFSNRLRHIRTALGGKDLQKMGLASGPRIKEILAALLKARLDGRVRTRQQEVEAVEELLKSN